ncbi:hypothetical protein [Pseudonocardia parietis]|uniref:Uncharacterized protein n=1 Tax=Pseudonocardia parietis TaxID=570936 RepID=A0ABS4VTM0_9PSEU|nr:hypothetical protein [Pseudonocardia parietis]MBP2367277.1 hypothetical protein [Pseudonocardia parietis]
MDAQIVLISCSSRVSGDGPPPDDRTRGRCRAPDFRTGARGGVR